MNVLEKAIISAVCYFDVFDYPLTILEIKKWLFFDQKPLAVKESIDLPAVMGVLEESENLKKIIAFKQGLFFLKGRDNIIDIRRKRYLIAEKKIQKALKIIHFFHFFPFIKMIGICNSLAFSNAQEKSDIDFFIITSSKRIWTVRFFTVFFTKFFRLRPTAEDTEDKICLSFFLTEDNLNLENTKLSNQDPYLRFWISQVLPVYDPQNIYPEFWQKNQWLKNNLANVLPNQPVSLRKISDHPLSFLSKNIFEFILKGKTGDFMEKIFKKIELKILPQKLLQTANQDTRVIIKDDILKFHHNDRRKEFNDLFQKRLDNAMDNL